MFHNHKSHNICTLWYYFPRGIQSRIHHP